MISVLIPIYNQDVTVLVRTLQDQFLLNKIKGEIICLDDGSEAHWKENNQSLSDLPYVSYQELNENIGRAAIRNRLAKLATFSQLLFLDGDSEIISSQFVSKYCQEQSKDSVVIGGRQYPSICPGDNFRLHWTYGRKREQDAISDFQSNNFMIPSAIFKQVRFDESIRSYGHEDTVFGYQLKSKGIKIIRINNPVLHASLETNDQYLKNQKSAIRNLRQLVQQYPQLRTRLTRVVAFLNLGFLSGLCRNLFESFEKPIIKNLNSSNPSMLLLDFYKVGIWFSDEAGPKEKRLS